MLKNADCTVFAAGTYARRVIPGVYWSDNRGRTASKNGAQIVDSVIVYLYDVSYIPKPGDMIVKGTIDFAFDVTSQQTISASMKRFREAYPQFAVIKNVLDCTYGGLPHIEVIAR